MKHHSLINHLFINWLSFLFFLLLLAKSSLGQDPEKATCELYLRSAEAAVLDGSFGQNVLSREQIPDELKKCIDDFYDKNQQTRAWVIIAKMYKDSSDVLINPIENFANAKGALQEVLKIDPEFDPRPIRELNFRI